MNGECWGVRDAEGLVRAIDAELAKADKDSEELQRKGRRTSEEAKYITALLTDIRADLAFAFGPYDPAIGFTRREPSISWQNKIRWIRLELEERTASYPELVAKGRMTEDAAALGLRTMKALHRLYWRGMFMWEPEPGPALDWIRRLRAAVDAAELEQLRASEAARIYREAAASQAALAVPAEQGSLLAA
jgi:hypothetical protein